MPRQPMFGALLAASAIALVQCAHTLSTDASTQDLPSAPAPNGTAVSSGEAPWVSERQAPGFKDLDLYPPPAHGPASPVLQQPAPPGASGARH